MRDNTGRARAPHAPSAVAATADRGHGLRVVGLCVVLLAVVRPLLAAEADARFVVASHPFAIVRQTPQGETWRHQCVVKPDGTANESFVKVPTIE